MNTRADIIRTIAENKQHIENHLSDFWRGWAADLVKGGIPAADVAETMITVAAVQCMQVHGSTRMAESLRQMADKFEFAADQGVEYCQREH